MKCKRVSRIDLVLEGGQWSGGDSTQVEMIATPLPMQPTGYVIKSWAEKPYGTIKTLTVDAVHDGHALAVRLQWEVPPATTTDFPPAVAFALPVKATSPLVLMGMAEAPMHILRWQGGAQAGVRSVLAKGIGSSNHGPDVGQKALARQDGNRFSVVITRVLGSGAGAAPLKAGTTTKIGFAAWDGGNEERAGIKSFSVDWLDLVLAA
ncbi:MAG: hypothetical protein M0P39_13370 [Rhodocyclaceae bacterium]|nr:hypothetical protein [Rhodocyclaceae bacterium]